MRRILVTISTMLLLSLMAASGTFAASVSVNALINNNTGKADISGNISSGEGKQVTVMVISPRGAIDYIDQATSGVGGSYKFSYTVDLEEKGIYQVTVGGTDVKEVFKTEFNYKGRDNSVDEIEETEWGVKITPGAASISKDVRGDGTVISKVNLDANIISEALQILERKDKNTQTIKVDVEEQGAVTLDLPTKPLTTAIKSDSNAVISLEIPSGYYDLPLQALKGKMNGKDRVQLNTEELADSHITEMFWDMKTVIAMKFHVTMVKNGKVEELNNFHKISINRGIILSDNLPLEKIIGLQYDSKTKTVSELPVNVKKVDGTTVAEMRLDRSAIYALVEKQTSYRYNIVSAGGFALLG